MTDTQREAPILSTYLLGRTCDAATSILYEQALGARGVVMTEAQAKLWARVLRQPRLLPFVDAGLALLDRYNPLRQRIFIMSAVLEVRPEFAGEFLPRRYRWHEIGVLMLGGCSAVLHSLAGVCLVRVLFRDSYGR